MSTSFVNIGRSLRHPNFRRFFFGQIISLIGTWITSLTTGWLVYRLTGSATLLASVTAVGMLPTVVIGPIAGAFIDRWSKHSVLLVTQFLSMLQSFALAGLTLGGIITIPQVFLLCAFQGAVNAFDITARQSLVPELIDDPSDLTNGIALNSAMMNAARLIGPPIGGLIISLSSEGVCFLIDGFSYLAVLVSLLGMKLSPVPLADRTVVWYRAFTDGVVYAFTFRPIGLLILLVGAASFSITPYTSLLTAFVREALEAGPRTVGLLMTAIGSGALVSALYLASRDSVLGLGRLIAYAGCSLGAAILALSLSSRPAHSAMALFMSGASMIFVTGACKTIIQVIVEPDKRARTLSLYAFAFTGAVPTGGFCASMLVGLIGIRPTIAIGAVVIWTMTAIFIRVLPTIRKDVRPIYRDLGILSGA